MENSIDTIIGINVVLTGNLRNKGSVQVNGTIEGEVRSEENINIGETAKIKGPVVAKTIEVSGQVKGTIEASEKLEINPTGYVVGDINAKSLIIKQGATFVGKSVMPGDERTVKETAAEPAKEDDDKAETEKAEEPADKLGFFSKK